MRCSSCSVDIPPDARFCPGCGAAFRAPASSPPQALPPTSPRQIPVRNPNAGCGPAVGIGCGIIAGIILLGCLIGGVAYWVSASHPSGFNHKAVANVEQASQLVGRFSNDDRYFYTKGLQHITRAHQKPGRYTIGQVIDDERSRESASSGLASVSNSAAANQQADAAAVQDLQARREDFCNRVHALMPGDTDVLVKSVDCALTTSGDYYVNAKIDEPSWSSLSRVQKVTLVKALFNYCVKASPAHKADDCGAHLNGTLRGHLGFETGDGSIQIDPADE